MFFFERGMDIGFLFKEYFMIVKIKSKNIRGVRKMYIYEDWILGYEYMFKGGGGIYTLKYIFRYSISDDDNEEKEKKCCLKEIYK